MEAHKLVNQISGNVEIYSPLKFIESAQNLMGSIDLDPASSLVANRRIQASQIFTEDMDGLTQDWWGNVWMNHPWGPKENACKANCSKKRCKTRGYHLLKDLPGNAAWINKLVGSYQHGEVQQALCITYASTSEGWFKPLKQFPICFLDGRTSFFTPDGDEMDVNTKGCAITYLGKHVQQFVEEFSQYGDVMLPATGYWRFIYGNG